jgi:DHA2 family lincomycin resistance protein-like MFS transporter
VSKSTPSAALLQPDLAAETRRNRRVIRLLLAATFVVILNETIMSVALSELMTDLGITG